MSAIAGAVRRGCEPRRILDERTLAAHCLHVTAGEMETLVRRGVNVVHNPQSNCNNAVGIAKALATDRRRGAWSARLRRLFAPRMWDEFKTAFHVQKLRVARPASRLRRSLCRGLPE